MPAIRGQFGRRALSPRAGLQLDRSRYVLSKISAKALEVSREPVRADSLTVIPGSMLRIAPE